MHAPRLTLTVAALAVVSSLVVGCDDNAADRKAVAAIEKGRAEATKGRPDDIKKSRATFDAAVNAKPGSGAINAAAHYALATTYLREYYGPISTPVKAGEEVSPFDLMYPAHGGQVGRLRGLELQAQRILSDMRLRGEQIATANTLIAGQQASDPKTTLAALDAQAGEINGNGATETWQTSEKTTLPTLSAVKQQLSELQGALAEKTQLVTDLAAGREASLNAAEAAQKLADTSKGDAAVAASTAMADARKKAEESIIQADNTRLEIARLESDLKVQQDLEASLTAGLDQLKEQSAAVTTSWENTQKQVAAQQTQLVAIASADAVAPDASLATRSKELAALLVEIQKTREVALALLTNADQEFDKAKQAADAFVKTPAFNSDITGPRQLGYTALTETTSPQLAKAEEAAVKVEVASLHSRSVSLIGDVIQTREMLKTVLAPSSTPMPPELDGIDIDKSRAEAGKAAEAAFVEAGDAVDGVTNAPPAVAQNAGRTSKLILLALWSDYYAHAAPSAGLISPDKAKEQADAKMKDAVAARANLIENNLRIPKLPGELGAPAPAATAVVDPAAAPATPDGTTPGATPGATPPAPTAPVATAVPGPQVIFDATAVAGDWVARSGSVVNNRPASELTMTLNADGTASTSLVTSDSDPTKAKTVVANGTFVIQGPKVVMTLATLSTGEAVPAANATMTFDIRVGAEEATATQPIELVIVGPTPLGAFTRPGQAGTAPAAAPATPATPAPTE